MRVYQKLQLGYYFSVELENTLQHNAILQKGSSSSFGATPNHSLIDNGEYFTMPNVHTISFLIILHLSNL